MSSIRWNIRSFVLAGLAAGIGILSPAAPLAQPGTHIVTVPAHPAPGQLVDIEVKFAKSCAGGRISFGDNSADGSLLNVPGAGEVAQHKYASAGTYQVSTYAASGSNATATANCKSGPFPIVVAVAPAAPPAPNAVTKINTQPVHPAPGQLVTIEVHFAATCAGGRISFGDNSADGQLSNFPGAGGVGQHRYASAGTYQITTYAPPGSNATATANCASGPFPIVVGTAPATPPAPPSSPNANTTATGAVCNDGTISNTTGKGACAHHGGIKKPASPPPAPPSSPNTNSPNTGSLCNDGTRSATTGKGSCAGHGGIKKADSTNNTPPAPPAP